MKITIRQATQTDAVSLANFAEHAFRETFSDENLIADMDMYCLENFASKIQEQEILDSNVVTFLAEVNGKLVGFAQLVLESAVSFIKSHRPSQLHRLYVSTEQHGHGLAHKIIQEVLHTASDANSDFIWLGVWEQNPKAIKFYKKYGFRVVGSHVFKLGLDPQLDLIMVTEVEDAIVV
jgi:ribosomal protein S18 acetylase RimI-like enzyme